jgi:hypothetical protein
MAGRILMHLFLSVRSAWRLVFALIVFLAVSLPSSARQAALQRDSGPLQPPLLSGTGPTDVTNFTITSVPKIPFSAVIVGENIDTDANGTRTVHLFHTKVARDSLGRIRVDVNLNPEGNPVDLRLLQTFIEDPVRKRSIILFHAQKVAIARSTVPPRPSKPSAPPTLREPLELSGVSVPFALVEIHNEELAPEVLNGFAVRHGRQSATYSPQSTGLDHSITKVTDYWFSTELQTFLLVKQVGPDSTVHTVKLESVSRLEPASSLFTIPHAYSVSKPLPSQSQSYGYCPLP